MGCGVVRVGLDVGLGWVRVGLGWVRCGVRGGVGNGVMSMLG